jgi:hypothetical protein
MNGFAFLAFDTRAASSTAVLISPFHENGSMSQRILRLTFRGWRLLAAARRQAQEN